MLFSIITSPAPTYSACLTYVAYGRHMRQHIVQRRFFPPSASAKSPHFMPLGSPANFTALLVAKEAAGDQITVIKYQAPWCRTCRAMGPRLDRVAKAFPFAEYYSLEAVRNGKAAGERMHELFLSRNATKLPYVEVYRGAELIEAHTIPPSNLELFSQAMGAALESAERARVGLLTQARARRQRQQAALRALLLPKDGISTEPPPPAAIGRGEALEGSRTANRVLQARSQSLTSKRRSAFRGAPVRGATGGRRTGR